MLTDEQQQAFIDWYIGRYYPNGTGEIPYPLPVLPKEKEEEEINAWKDFLTKLIGVEKSEQTYKIRQHGQQSILDKVFSSLRLQYGPVFK